VSADQFRGSGAEAFRLAALLEIYEARMEELESCRMASAAHAQVRQLMEEMRVVCAGLPLLVVAWLQLMISHAELCHELWKCQQAGGSSAPPQACKDRHHLAVRSLHKLCLGQFTRVECRQ
jgi:hypothetical protein